MISSVVICFVRCRAFLLDMGNSCCFLSLKPWCSITEWIAPNSLSWNELYWSNCAQILDGVEEIALIVGRMGFFFTKIYLQLSILIKASFSMCCTVPHFIINYLKFLHTMTTQTNRLYLLQNKVSYNLSASVIFCFAFYWGNTGLGFPGDAIGKEPACQFRRPKRCRFSPSKEHPGLISFRMDWLDLLAVQGTLMSLIQHHSSKASILWCSAFFTVQLSHPYMTTGKTIALTRRTFVGKVMSLLFNMLSRLVITFLLYLNISNVLGVWGVAESIFINNLSIEECA